MGKPAARVGDQHVCPLHPAGPVLPPGKPTVFIGGKPAATFGSLCTCTGPPSVIMQGSKSVYINGMRAARKGDVTSHGGQITEGEDTVLIGDDEADTEGEEVAQPTPASPLPLTVQLPYQCAYLSKGQGVSPPRGTFDRIRSQTSLSEPTPIQYQFRGRPQAEDALQYTVFVNGRQKTVIVPASTTSPHGFMPTIQQVERSLGVIPAPLLDNYPAIEVSPYPSPDDAYWQDEYNSPDHRSAATAGTSGITLYPLAFDPPQATVDNIMVHEHGHPFHQTLWGRSSRAERDWRAAMAADPMSPSLYADKSIGEDFSESLLMYMASRGTACEAPARQLYPNRYQLLDQLIGSQGDPQQSPSPSAPRRSFWDWFFGR